MCIGVCNKTQFIDLSLSLKNTEKCFVWYIGHVIKDRCKLVLI